MTITTPRGHQVRVHPQHALRFLRAEDVADQARYTAMLQAGKVQEVMDEITAACRSAVAHIQVSQIMRGRA